MPRSVYSLAHYQFTKLDKLFFDTNMWLFVYGNPRFRNPRMDEYRNAFRRINAAQCQIYVDFVVLSEFIHVCISEAWKDYKKYFANFKAFRQSLVFKKAVDEIDQNVDAILARCHYLDGGVGKPRAIKEVLFAYKTGQMDINDHIIARVCAQHGITLVTDDVDFAMFAKQKTTRQIRILTANPTALNPRK